MTTLDALRIDPALMAAPSDFQTLLNSEVRLSESPEKLRKRYQQARPFPHLIIDNLFPAPVLDAVLGETPDLSRDNWVYFDKEGLQKVLRMRSSTSLGPASFQLAAFLHSSTFLYLLSELTGIWQLLPDPYLQGAGHAAMRRGMYFKIHTDRNTAYETGLQRRLAMIIFLNKDWKSEYAGQLELWNHLGTHREVSIEPLFNRTVLFEVANPNFHGVPAPLNCPEDRARQSFICYYHTAVGADDRAAPSHTSLFAPSAVRRRQLTWRTLLDESAPPFLLRMIKRWLKPGF